MKKVKILLNWDTSRKDLLEPFITLNDEIDFVIIWGEESDKDNHPFEQVYFTNYRTPYQLLKAVRPDKILFFNINSYPQVALNLAAKNLRIPTFTMHHGIHHSDHLEINRQKETWGLKKRKTTGTNFSSLRFYFSALRLRNISQVIPFFYFAWLRRRRDTLVALQKCVFEGRLPGKYINLSPHNAIIIKRINHLTNDDKFIYIGHPFFDRILQELNNLKQDPVKRADRYFLLIDFPNKEEVLYFKMMTAEKKLQFYKNLSALAKHMGCRLKVKLHPFGYDSAYNYQDDNIDLVREADIASLIFYADKCFSFFSSLIIPIVYHKKGCYLFNFGSNLQLQKELVELGVARELKPESFGEKDLSMNHHKIDENAYTQFVERYLYYTDGNSTERLKNVLIST